VIKVKTTKKAISIVLAGLITAGSMSALSVSAVEETSPTLSFKTQNALYAHAVSGSADSDAWVAWQCEHNEDMNEINANQKYFFFRAVFHQQALRFIMLIQTMLQSIMLLFPQASQGRFPTQLTNQPV